MRASVLQGPSDTTDGDRIKFSSQLLGAVVAAFNLLKHESHVGVLPLYQLEFSKLLKTYIEVVVVTAFASRT
jgi:FMN-dependent NADH-azoreductase